jgi:hypothetical protein
VFAVGNHGTILHYDGIAWAPMDSGTKSDLTSVWGRNSQDVFVSGTGGMLHWDGVRWTPIAATPDTQYEHLWGSGSGAVFAVGSGDAIAGLRGRPPTLDGGACAAPVPIYCGSASPAIGDTTGMAARINRYACADPSMDGPEVFYRLDSPITGQVTLRLAPRAGNLHLIAVGAGTDGGCDPSGRCLATAQQQLTLPVTQGGTYYFVVDGPSGGAAGYSLGLECVPSG